LGLRRDYTYSAIEKTKSITFAKVPVRCRLVVQDKIIEQVSQFKYLGMDLSSCHVKDLRRQINKASAMSGCLRQTDIREQCGVQDIVRWGRQGKRYWYAHVRRMEEGRLPWIALEGKRVPHLRDGRTAGSPRN